MRATISVDTTDRTAELYAFGALRGECFAGTNANRPALPLSYCAHNVQGPSPVLVGRSAHVGKVYKSPPTASRHDQILGRRSEVLCSAARVNAE